MKAILEFNLPEEEHEHSYALAGIDALIVINDLEADIRSFMRHDCGEFAKWRNDDDKECSGDYDTLQRVWDVIIRMKQDRRLPELT